MVWLPDGEKFSKISLFVLTQVTNLADIHTDRRTDTAWQHSPRLCIAWSHRAAKTSSASHVNFDSFVVFMCLFRSKNNTLKRNLQPKFKGASVWPKSTAVITGVIFTCPGRVGPVFRLDCGLTYFARIALRAWQHTMEQWSHIFAQNHDSRMAVL